MQWAGDGNRWWRRFGYRNVKLDGYEADDRDRLASPTAPAPRGPCEHDRHRRIATSSS